MLITLLVFVPSSAQAVSAAERLALTAGVSELLVLGPVSSALTTSLDVTARGALYRALGWSGGARLGLGPVSPEAFGRLSLRPRLGAWTPAVGLELGLSGRARDDHGDALLSELRAQSRAGLVPLYLALHASPLCFHVRERFVIGALDLQLGSYVAPFGRFVRVQLGIVSAGIAL